MNIRDLLKEDSIILHTHNQSKEEAIDQLVERHFQCQHIQNKEVYKEAILAREALSSTGVGNMIAIPHAQNDTVNYPSLVAMVDQEGVNFDSLDQLPAKVFFMIAVPKDGGSQHLEILAQLCQILMDEKIVNALLEAQTQKQFLDILTGEFIEEKNEEKHSGVDVVAVTACPTGIAHTYMAAKALEDTAKKLGIKIKVETNGASGAKNQLTDQDITQAKCVIVAADKKVEMKRFTGKPIIQVPVADGIHKANELLEKAMSGDVSVKENSQLLETKKKRSGVKGIRIFYEHLMNGISNIIPVLMIYGVSVSVIEVLNLQNTLYNGTGETTLLSYFQSTTYVAQFVAIIMLSAFIADSISDRPGFVVGAVSSLLIATNQNIFVIILIGFISGYVVLLLKKIFSYLPEVLDSIVPNLLLPICGTFIMVLILNFFPITQTDNTISISQAILSPYILLIIGFLLGAMMSVDMGGPINKTAYAIGIMGIFAQRYDIMSAVMIGGMIPPIVLYLSMQFSPSLFNQQEKEGKWRCLIKGLCFVSEEAIPYMSQDKKGIHIPCIIASGIAGALSMYFGCSQMFPHGGIFTVPLVTNPLLFLIALLSSSLIGMSLILIMKKTSL